MKINLTYLINFHQIGTHLEKKKKLVLTSYIYCVFRLAEFTGTNATTAVKQQLKIKIMLLRPRCLLPSQIPAGKLDFGSYKTVQFIRN